MTATPKGYHDAEAWVQVEGKTRSSGSWERENDGAGAFVVTGIKVKSVTQSRPNPPAKGCIAVKVTLRIPDGAFLPFAPEAVITVPENMVVRGPIEAEVVGEIDDSHKFVTAAFGSQCAFRRDDVGDVCGAIEADPIHTKEN